MRVDVYKNLHKSKTEAVYSIRSLPQRIVIRHVKSIALTHVLFIVSQKGRQRVLRERRKNIHAVVRGIVAGMTSREGYKKAYYNPYTTNGFFKLFDSNKSLYGADSVIIDNDGIWVKGEF